ncbi:tetratricopeptide repeat protein [Patescibacteria group bacterium]|nr:tetratricopeptide repeat protein [Patescibacteria group bacterium]
MKQKLLILLAFLIAAFLAFGHSLYQGFAPVDDIFLIVENLAIRGMSWENLKHVFTTYDPELYIPLVFVSFQINWLISGLEPFGFHLTNILLHVANSLLVFGVLKQLTGEKKLSLLAGLIFAVHPLNAEAVVWLAGRKDLLSAVFFLGSLFLYLNSLKIWNPPSAGIRYLESTTQSLLSQSKGYSLLTRTYFFSILFFLLALLSKIIAVTLLGVIILHMLLIERGRFDKSKIIRLSPYVILSVIFMAVAMGGKGRVVAAVGLWDKVLVACKSSIFYIQKLLFPTDLTIIYPLQGDISLWSSRIFPYFILTFLLAWIALRSWRKHPWITFGIGWYISTLAPTYLNIGKAGLVFFAVDRYAYLPMIGLLYIFVCVLSRTKSSVPIFQYSNIRIPEVVSLIVGSLLIIVLVVISQVQTRTWDTPEGVFLRTLEIYPDSIGARVGLSTIYRRQNKLTESFEVLREGLKNGNHMLLELHAGYVYAATGQVGDAEARFKAAAEMDPDHPEPYFSLGSLYEQTGSSQDVIPLYEKAIELDDSYVIARARLGNLYLEEGRVEEAKEQFEKALEWNKFSVEANKGMEELYLMQK